MAGDVDDNGIYAGNQDRTIKLDTGDAIEGTMGGLTAVLTHPEVGAQTDHKVNGVATDLDPPQLESATVDDDTLTLTYDEALDEGSVPAASAYTVAVTVGATTTNPTVTVAVGGRTVTLTLSAAPADGAAVTVSYTVPTGTGAMPVQDLVGNDAPAFSGTTVTRDVQLRLMDGTGDHEGRLEIRYEGQWGTVCDDYWTDVEADVACRALGYPQGSVVGGGSRFDRAHFGSGSGSILLDDVNCVGNETSLLECDYRKKNGVKTVGHHNCSHREDVGVRCQLAARARVAQAPEVSPSGSDGWTSGETLTFSEAVTADTADGTHTAVRVTANTLRTNGGRIYATSTERDAALGHEAASLQATVSPPLPALSVFDAEVQEGSGARLDFEVTLSPAADVQVGVYYETADGTARVGSPGLVRERQ